MAILCCRVCKSTPIIFISASFVPSNLWLEHHHLTRRVVRPTSLCHQTGRFLLVYFSWQGLRALLLWTYLIMLHSAGMLGNTFWPMTPAEPHISNCCDAIANCMSYPCSASVSCRIMFILSWFLVRWIRWRNP